MENVEQIVRLKVKSMNREVPKHKLVKKGDGTVIKG